MKGIAQPTNQLYILSIQMRFSSFIDLTLLFILEFKYLDYF